MPLENDVPPGSPALTIRQLIREFWMPFAVAGVWVAANAMAEARYPGAVKVLNWFVPAFFFASWMSSQWFRVRKQQKVDEQLDRLHLKVSEVLSDLEQGTKHLAGQLSGGDDFCYLIVMAGAWADAAVICMHPGEYPLHNLAARVVDIEGYASLGQRMAAGAAAVTMDDFAIHEQRFTLDILLPQHVASVPVTLRLGDADRRGFNIFFTARNGGFLQSLRLRRTASGWTSATQVKRGDKVLYQSIDGLFPLESPDENPFTK